MARKKAENTEQNPPNLQAHQKGRRKERRVYPKTILEMEPNIREFCLLMAEGKSSHDAAYLAEFPNPAADAKKLLQRSDVRSAMRYLYQRTMEKSEISREDVIAGFKDAIDIARMQSEAMPMIAGWREIGKMLGMYEAKKVEVTIQGDAQAVAKQLQGMSDKDLLKQITDSSNIIEGEFEEMDEDDDASA